MQRKRTVSTPERKCIGFPEQEYITDAGKKNAVSGVPQALGHLPFSLIFWPSAAIRPIIAGQGCSTLVTGLCMRG